MIQQEVTWNHIRRGRAHIEHIGSIMNMQNRPRGALHYVFTTKMAQLFVCMVRFCLGGLMSRMSFLFTIVLKLLLSRLALVRLASILM